MPPPPSAIDIIAAGKWERALFTTYALSLTFFETHRQAQRLALEALFAWTEGQILQTGQRDAREISRAAFLRLRERDKSLFGEPTCGKVFERWLGRFKSLDAYIEACIKGDSKVSFFDLSLELQQIVVEQPEAICPHAFRLLLIAYQMTIWLADVEGTKGYLSRGGVQRVSLAYWRKMFENHKERPFTDLVATVLENLVLSQHFAVATTRFDGAKQRLRIALEENGLESLVDRPWQPGMSADHLATALSLMSDCGLLRYNEKSNCYGVA